MGEGREGLNWGWGRDDDGGGWRPRADCLLRYVVYGWLTGGASGVDCTIGGVGKKIGSAFL